MGMSRKEFEKQKSRKEQERDVSIISKKVTEIEESLDENLKKGSTSCSFDAADMYRIYNNNYIRDSVIRELKKKYRKAWWRDIVITNISKSNVVTVELK